MQILLHFWDEEIGSGLWVIWNSQRFCLVCEGTENIFQILLREEVWNPTTSDHPVNVDQKLLADNLRVCHQEHSWFAPHTCSQVNWSKLLLQILNTVVGSDWYLSHIKLTHVCHKPTQTLFSGAAYSDQHGISSGVLNYPVDSGNVKYRLLEEDEIHYGIVVIVFHQFRVQDGFELFHWWDWKIRAIWRGRKIGKHIIRLEQILGRNQWPHKTTLHDLVEDAGECFHFIFCH